MIHFASAGAPCQEFCPGGPDNGANSERGKLLAVLLVLRLIVEIMWDLLVLSKCDVILHSCIVIATFPDDLRLIFDVLKNMLKEQPIVFVLENSSRLAGKYKDISDKLVSAAKVGGFYVGVAVLNSPGPQSLQISCFTLPHHASKC